MQKNPYMVPWADKSEWEDVRRKIYSEKDRDVVEAYETMTMWQLRSNNLPAYVDCTVGILQVMVQEYLTEKSILNDYDLRLSYSTALIRFINHVHDVSNFKYNSLYRSAKIQNIPDWLITMRHDAAHGRVLPALETFHLAAKVSLQWLLENYWFQEEKYLSNLGANHFEADITINNLDLSLLPIYKTAIIVWGACLELMNNSLKLISDLSEDQLSHIGELINMCRTNASLKKNGSNCVVWLKKIMKVCKTCETFQPSRKKILHGLKTYIQELLESITYGDAARYAFVQSILQSDFMLDTSKNDWENVIHLVQSLKCFQHFLESLFELAGMGNDMAVNLLRSLLPSIEVLKLTWSKYAKMMKIDESRKTKKLLKKSTLLKYRKKCRHLDIRLKLRTPPKIKFQMVQNILSNPTDRSCGVALKCLPLIEPPLPEVIHDEVRRLIRIYRGSEAYKDGSNEETEKIYTLEDLGSHLGIMETEEDVAADSGNWSWVRSNESVETWSNCPLGLLPHQKRVDCNLPEDVKWKTESPSVNRKRASSSLLTCQSEGMKKLKNSLKNIDA